MTLFKTYSELKRYATFESRYKYLKLDGQVGRSTFGFDRFINQKFYQSNEWKRARDYVILRDEGCDLGVLGYDIHGKLLIHHMNPIVVDDIIHGRDWIIDPEFLITTTPATHNAIHFGNERMLPKVVTARKQNDTRLW